MQKTRIAAFFRSRWLILLALAVMAISLGIAATVEAPRLLGGLSELGFRGIAGVLALSLINYALRYVRWSAYLKLLGHRLPQARHLAYYLAGFAFTITPAKLGEAVRGAYLRRHGVPWGHTLAALFIERLLDVLAISVLIAITAGPLLQWQGLGLALGLGVLLFIGLLTRPQLPDWGLRLGNTLPERLAAPARTLSAWLRDAAQLLTPFRLLAALLIGILAWGLEGLGLYWLAGSMGVQLSVQAAIAIYAVSVLAGVAVFFMPAGLGGMEAAMTALLVASGADLPTAFVITMLCRFATLWFAVVIGFVASLLLELTTMKGPEQTAS